jgi:hypothetical protein
MASWFVLGEWRHLSPEMMVETLRVFLNLRRTNRPCHIRRSQAGVGEGSSNLGVLCGFEVVTVRRRNLQGSQQAASEALSRGMSLGEVKGGMRAQRAGGHEQSDIPLLSASLAAALIKTKDCYKLSSNPRNKYAG